MGSFQEAALIIFPSTPIKNTKDGMKRWLRRAKKRDHVPKNTAGQRRRQLVDRVCRYYTPSTYRDGSQKIKIFQQGDPIRNGFLVPGFLSFPAHTCAVVTPAG
ncbi:hypothetical protein NQ317_002757 [Molorchus minor]|uniref:Uncharacterized protein n=1 Tax=Molorchus minor TaxID=1323400 RepID=A0ABQ9IVS3_9CUCU|nr:hypothetical protein NQ317_002757 [Molorchus minor]